MAEESYFRFFYCKEQDAEARAFKEKTGWNMIWGTDNQGLNGDTWIVYRDISDLPAWLQDYAREESK